MATPRLMRTAWDDEIENEAGLKAGMDEHQATLVFSSFNLILVLSKKRR